MKKFIFNALIALISIVCLDSCTYDYEMPDYSGACPIYVIESIPSEVRQVWIHEAEKYGLDLGVSAEKWDYLVCELSEQGDTLYTGLARGKADHNARKLKVGYCCKGKYLSYEYTYYDICTFWIDHFYSLEVSPYPSFVNISISDKYAIVPPLDSERVYLYDITFDNSVTTFMINLLKSLGYEVMDSKMSVIEQDKDGNILYQGAKHPLSKKGAKTVVASIDFYGSNAGSEKVKVATITFGPFEIEHKMDITLTTDMEYSIETIPIEERSVPYTVTYDSEVANLMINTSRSLGYEPMGTKVYVVEKDKDGNVLYKGERHSVCEKGAKTVEVFIDFYGSNAKSSQVKVGTISFGPFEIEANMTITLTTDMEYSIETIPIEERSVPYTVSYDSEVTILMINTSKSLGYELMGTKVYVVEKDKDGNVLYKGERHSVCEKGAETVEVFIDFYGSNAKSSQVKVGTISFGPFEIEANMTITLTTDMDYKIETYSNPL